MSNVDDFAKRMGGTGSMAVAMFAIGAAVGGFFAEQARELFYGQKVVRYGDPVRLRLVSDVDFMGKSVGNNRYLAYYADHPNHGPGILAQSSGGTLFSVSSVDETN